MKLSGVAGSLSTKKAFVFLVEKACVFEFEPIRDGTSRSLSADVFPGRVHEPALIDRDFTVRGAAAICSYVEEYYPTPALVPHDLTERMAATYVEECFSELADVILGIEMDEAGEIYSNAERGEALVQHRLRPILAYLEKLKAKSPFLVSEQFCIADISVGVALMAVSKHRWIPTSAPIIDRSTFARLSSDYPLMRSYCDALWKRESFQEVKNLWEANYGPARNPRPPRSADLPARN